MTAELPDVADEVLAVGWATVELDRAARELASLLTPGTRFEVAPASQALGASARVGRARSPEGRSIAIVLLEPDTEGRLAAALARWGEGWTATWISVPPREEGDGPAEGQVVSAARAGPFGLERLVLGGPIRGPYRLLVEAATIAP